MLQEIGYYLSCLLLPIVWGVAVNFLFSRWRKRRLERQNSNVIDYQI